MEKLFREVINPNTNKIIAIGKNYLAPNEQPPAEPIIFQKPFSSIVPPGVTQFSFPNNGRDVLHEIELGVMIGRGGRNIKQDDALTHVGGYFLGLDLTDKQYFLSSREKGLPWDLAKGQDKFFPISEFIPVDKVKDPHNLILELTINGKVVQRDLTGSMHYKVDKLISYSSEFMTLNPGDLFLTGTPGGVGLIKNGDIVDAVLLQGNEVIARIHIELTAPVMQARL
ncbi:hypothetical protein ABPG74_014562 [Tetrahymena malaccensis]